ncbi:Eco57I restriction-modification methylase domain-containing protein [Desulfobacterales bacterium HSG16]|nr:Eco57I restriction-modification methylase domain-containing protein [Desulfobacterales bacterium HSG16]
MDKGEDTHKKAKRELQKRLDKLNGKLNEYLGFAYYEIDKKMQQKEYAEWLESHQPFHWISEFYEIINGKGGFDVVIGNPPYVVYSDTKFHYNIMNYKSIDCKDLYGFVIERSYSLNCKNGRNGMIIPISIISTDGFRNLRKLMVDCSSHLYFSSYAMRPGKLFDGVDKHLTIFLACIGNQSALYSSKYYRWKSDARNELLDSMSYVEINNSILHNSSIPKISTLIESSILSKLKLNSSIDHCLTGAGNHNGYHTRKLRYFVQFLDCVPKIFEENGCLRVTSELKTLKFPSETKRFIGIAVYLSDIFFWYYIDYSDCRNVNKREVYSFPFSMRALSLESSNNLYKLGNSLLDNLQENSYYKTAAYKKYGVLKMQTFQPRKSKPIIDQIDTVLAQHYNFTEEELDFIINYDIKYRMGKELDSYIEGTLNKKSDGN